MDWIDFRSNLTELWGGANIVKRVIVDLGAAWIIDERIADQFL